MSGSKPAALPVLPLPLVEAAVRAALAGDA